MEIKDIEKILLSNKKIPKELCLYLYEAAFVLKEENYALEPIADLFTNLEVSLDEKKSTLLNKNTLTIGSIKEHDDITYLLTREFLSIYYPKDNNPVLSTLSNGLCASKANYIVGNHGEIITNPDAFERDYTEEHIITNLLSSIVDESIIEQTVSKKDINILIKDLFAKGCEYYVIDGLLDNITLNKQSKINPNNYLAKIQMQLTEMYFIATPRNKILDACFLANLKGNPNIFLNDQDHYLELESVYPYFESYTKEKTISK